jgi:hypothetical protein
MYEENNLTTVGVQLPAEAQDCVDTCSTHSSIIKIDLDKTEWLMILESLRTNDHADLANKVRQQLEGQIS